MFSKSLIQTDHIRPQWFTAAITPTPDRVTLVTVLTMDEWPHLARLAEVYKGKYGKEQNEIVCTTMLTASPLC